jgi:ribosome-binding factor A
MKKNFDRAYRVADLLQRELAILIQKELKDPRVGMVTITDVEVSGDLRYAKVYFSYLQSELSATDIETALNGAKGFLRSMLAKQLSLRTTPELKFMHDDSLRKGQHLDKLIEQAVNADQDLHQSTDTSADKE